MPIPRRRTNHSRTSFYMLLGALVLACGSGPDGPEHNTELAMLGDSITWQAGYSAIVADTFPPDEVIRLAWFGYTTRDLLPETDFYQRANLDQAKPRIATILIGINDASLIPHVSVDEYLDNLTRIVDQLLADGVGTVVVLAPPRYFDPFPFTITSLNLVRQYVDAIWWLCSVPDDDIVCGPNLFDLIEDDLTDDGVHPNAEGHALIAEELMPFLE